MSTSEKQLFLESMRPITPQEAAVVAAAMEWIEAKTGAQYGPNHRQLTCALNQLNKACCDLASECDGEPWRNPHD